MKLPYCSGSGRSRPSRWLTSAMVCAVARRPAIVLAGSWGVTKNSTNTAPLTIHSTSRPRRVRRRRKRSTSRLLSAGGPAGGGVQRVADAVAQQVERERGGQQRQPREQREPPGDLVEGQRVAEHPAPGRGGWGHAEAEERQGSPRTRSRSGSAGSPARSPGRRGSAGSP